MEQEQPEVKQQLNLIYQRYNPHQKSFQQLATFLLKQCKGSTETLIQYLCSLNQEPIYMINFTYFRKFIRLIKKCVISHKSQKAELLLSSYLIKCVSIYFPYQIRSIHAKQFQKFIQLVKGLKIQEPKGFGNQREIIIYLECASYNEQWGQKLIQILNSQIFVDKKNQSSKALKLNQFFSPFLVKNIEKIIPQLDRLLVRSDSNIQVWQQAFIHLTTCDGMKAHILPLLKKIKNYFMTYPQVSENIINSLGRGLKDLKAINELTQFVIALLNNEHNAKKKIIFMKMTQGIMIALGKLSLSKDQNQKTESNKLANDILTAFSNSFIKFNEQEQFIPIMNLLQKLLPLIKDPSQNIAKSLKLYVKNTNKYILIYLGVTLSIYEKQQIQNMPAVKQIFAHFKSQINTIQKAVQANWQWFIHIIAFMSKSDSSYIENLSQNLPIFKSTSVTLTLLQKNKCLTILMAYYRSMIQDEVDLTDNFFTALTILLQQIKQKEAWQNTIDTLCQDHRLQIISKGIYSLLWYPCQNLQKNKNNNHFRSLVRFITSSLKNGLNGYKVQDIHKILITCRLTFVKINKKFEFANIEQNHKYLQSMIIKFWKASMIDYQSEEELFVSDNIKTIIDIGAKLLLEIHCPDEFNQILNKVLDPAYYQKNLDFIISFQEEARKELLNIIDHMKQSKNRLIERNFFKEPVQKQKKIYVNPYLFDAKMMSEAEVKAEKYRKHFLKMIRYYEMFVNIISFNISQSEFFLLKIWQNHFRSLIKITQYPQARLGVYRIVRKSVQRTSYINRKFQQSKIFVGYSIFFASFFCTRNSNITPSIQLMEKSSSFLKKILQVDFMQDTCNMIFDLKRQFIMLFVNDMCEQILENMEFDLSIKKLAIHFYYKCQKRMINFGNEDILFTHILKNINILSSSEHVQVVLRTIMKRVDTKRYQQLFQDILSFVTNTKILILEVISKLQTQYEPQFQSYIKLRIMALQNNQKISNLSNEIIKNESSQNKDILKFNMKNFIKKNSKQTVQKLCLFIKEQMKNQQIQPVFRMVISTLTELYNQKFDQEGLQIFPYFLMINLSKIPLNLMNQIFQLLVLKFTANQNYATLSKLSMQIGIQIIKTYAVVSTKNAQSILKVLEGFINKATGVSNIVFLGVLAPYLQGHKNLMIIQKRITQLFMGNKQNEQKSIAKCMPDLMSFFKQPAKLVQKIYMDINGLAENNQIGQAYLAVGLLKGIGHKLTMQYLQRTISEDYITKTKSQKSARIYLLNSFVQIFGRFTELKANRIVQILIGYMADSIQQIRNISKKVGQSLVIKLSSFAVKNLLPALLTGLQTEQNWRVKISYIWILGVMANCSARQLQTSLPIIVPTLSSCLSNAHPTIRNKASQALNLIGQTIKNPQISQSIDILIEALQNPFQKSDRALDILLKTRFSHYIDAPSLSIIIPIIDYCLRGRSSQLKSGASQVIGSIVELIQNPYDLLPYLKIITIGLKTALCDPLSEIRCIAAMAIGRISSKIGIKQAEQYFKFVLQIIQNPLSNTTERQGAAQAYSEIICSHDFEYFQESLNRIFQKLKEVKHSQKQGYILVFLYVPTIRREQFQGFIKEVNQNMYMFVSDEDQNVRNSAMLVEKVLINNYCLSHTDLLLNPLCQSVFENNWRKRNAALILIGELLNIIKSYMYNNRTTDKNYAYYRGLMAVYILKDDQLQMPRLTANQVWNTYIENTPKTIRTGLKELLEFWAKFTHSANGVVFKNIGQFSSKYGQNYFFQILGYMKQFMANPLLQKGLFDVLMEFVKRLQQQFLMKEQYRNLMREFFSQNVFSIQQHVRESLARCLAIYVQKMKEEKFFQQLIYPQIDKMDTTSEQNQKYTKCLHLLRDLLHTSSPKIVDKLINKIMETPLSEFKIEVITNNADRLANHLYTLFKRPATQVFVDEIYTLVNDKSKSVRLEIIIYCLQQVSLKLNMKFKTQFMTMINNHIRKLTNQLTDQTNLKILSKLLGIIIFFLHNSELKTLQQLQTLISELAPLIFVKQFDINQKVHQIFELMISNPKQSKTALYLKQIVVSLENNANNRNTNIIWEDKNIAKNNISILVKCIAYGSIQVMEEAIQMMNFFMRFTKREIIDKEILRIVGPVIRTVNYPLLMKQKVQMMEFLDAVYKKHFNIEVYSHQILSVCFRLLQEFKGKQDIMEVVSNTFQNLLLNSSNKNDLMLTIIHKIKIYGVHLVQAVYYLMKTLINGKVQLPKATYQKTYQQFSHIAIQNQTKLPLRGVYFASKTAARLAVYLGVHIEKLQAQISGLTCPFQVLLNYLHFSYYKKSKVPKLQAIEIFIKESSHEKVFYLLKSLKLCCKSNQQTKTQYSLEYIKKLVPQTLSGFDDLIQILQEFE